MSKGVPESLCEISHLSCLQSQSELWCRVRVNFSEGVRENFFKDCVCVCVCADVVLCMEGLWERQTIHCIVFYLGLLDLELYMSFCRSDDGGKKGPNHSIM